MKYTLSVKVENEAGVLMRISGLFARRGFNIESLAVGKTERSDISRITLVVNGNQHTLEQIIKQLDKLINVLEIKNLTNSPFVERELVLIKIKAIPEVRPEILEIAQIFRAKIIDVASTSVIVEITGDPGKIVACEQLLKKFGIIETVRAGKIALSRESNVNSEFLRNSIN